MVYVKFLQRVDTNRIIGGGNREPADKPCQNQIDLLTGALFIQWIVLFIPRFKYWCLNKKKGTYMTCIQF